MIPSDPLPIDKGLKGFQETSLEGFERLLQSASSQQLMDRGEQMAFQLFHQMARRVPAYVDFLEQRQMRPESIRSPQDLIQVPWMDKDNYLRQYPLDALSWDGVLHAPIISSSSGSSGTPTFWPRSEAIETETSYIFEFFLKNFFEVDKYRTLYISAFAMGIYVGGSFTLNCSMRISQKGYPLTIVTPGINKKEFLESYESLHPYFDQIILGGYPPLVKDILDLMEEHGFDLKNKKVRFHFAAEAISEEFRQYMYSRIGVTEQDYCTHSMNLYGTADAAVAGHESPLAILLRRMTAKDPRLASQYFGAPQTPSLNAYYPFFKHFEVVDSELLFSSASNMIPLCRYNIHDRGGIITADAMRQMAAEQGISREALTAKLGKHASWNLPHVYLFGKTDNSVKLSGAIIYAESIKKALESSPIFDKLTGKFTMETRLNEIKDQYLLIHIELKQHVREIEEYKKQELVERIVDTLMSENAEYRAICSDAPEGHVPILEFHAYQDEQYFTPGIKQRWVKQS